MREIKEQKINTKRCRKRIFRNSYEKQRKVVSRFCDQNKTASTLCWNFWCIFIFFVRISLSNSSISSALYGRVEIVNATYVVLTCSMIVLKDHFCLIATLFWVMIRNYCVAFFFCLQNEFSQLLVWTLGIKRKVFEIDIDLIKWIFPFFNLQISSPTGKNNCNLITLQRSKAFIPVSADLCLYEILNPTKMREVGQGHSAKSRDRKQKHKWQSTTH